MSNITSKRFKVILERYHELVTLAEHFTNRRSIRFDYDGNIEDEINTSCHCHPEYEWRTIKTKEEFAEWLDKQHQQ